MFDTIRQYEIARDEHATRTTTEQVTGSVWVAVATCRCGWTGEAHRGTKGRAHSAASRDSHEHITAHVPPFPVFDVL